MSRESTVNCIYCNCPLYGWKAICDDDKKCMERQEENKKKTRQGTTSCCNDGKSRGRGVVKKDKLCPVCRKSFLPPCRFPNYKYCSRECRTSKYCSFSECRIFVKEDENIWSTCPRHLPRCTFEGCKAHSDSISSEITGRNTCKEHSIEESSGCGFVLGHLGLGSSAYGLKFSVHKYCGKPLKIVQGEMRFKTESPMCNEHVGHSPKSKITR